MPVIKSSFAAMLLDLISNCHMHTRLGSQITRSIKTKINQANAKKRAENTFPARPAARA